MGAEAYLVPMYTQAFDVFAIAPDFVLANYVRPNNVDLLRRYRAAGMRIGVLDTEGAAGKSGDDYAHMVGRMQCGELVHVYCMWGVEQYEAFRRHDVAPAEVLQLTGCPRYDYCAEPWRRALPVPDHDGPYVLVNTNFPVVNPRFSAGAEEECSGMVRAGFDAEFAGRFLRDARRAHEAVIDVIGQLAARFSEQRFVLRPHPFESDCAYAPLAQLANVQIRQEGTSLEWIRPAKALIHQNCSTAIEAVMLEREPIALEWFNTPALLVNGPSRVSRHANSIAELEALVRGILADEIPGASEETLAARRDIIRALYYANDGMAGQRVASAIMKSLERGQPADGRKPIPSGMRFQVVHAARRIMGYRGFERLRRSLRGAEFERRRESKRFSLEQVQTILYRLAKARTTAQPVQVGYSSGDTSRARFASGQTIKVAAA